MKRKPKAPASSPVHVTCADEYAGTPEEYSLINVLCFYDRAPYRARGFGGSDQVAMRHAVSAGGVIGPGVPFDPVEFARTLYRLKQGEMVEKLVLVGDHVLAENRDAVLWWRPATISPMWFKTATPTGLTAFNGAPVPHPPLVFRASKRRRALSCWALAVNTRPSAETPLFVAPYMNQFHGGGDICLGNARTGAESPSTPEEWENLFFETNFSHTPPPLCLTTDNEEEADSLARYIAFLTSLTQAQVPPENWARLLRPAKRTLAGVLSQD